MNHYLLLIDNHSYHTMQNGRLRLHMLCAIWLTFDAVLKPFGLTWYAPTSLSIYVYDFV